jgi:hypothetical protein
MRVSKRSNEFSDIFRHLKYFEYALPASVADMTAAFAATPLVNRFSLAQTDDGQSRISAEILGA